MHYTQAVAAIAVVASIASATPIQKRSPFTVNQVASGKKAVKFGPAVYAKALAKYTKQMPDWYYPGLYEEAIALFEKRQETGSVQNEPTSGDESYLCPVEIGTPAQTLMLDFDTGSSDLWVISTELSNTNGFTPYNPSASSTSSEEQGETWNISYGDGSGASGNVFADQVVVGGVTATSQAVEAATSISSEFQQDTGTDGLLGLAFSSINTVTPNQVTTWFQTVSGQLAANLFTASLKHNAPGSYDFGDIDSSKYSGDITYVPVDNSQGFWQFNIDGANGQSVSGSDATTIADTGTTLILVSNDILQNYYSQIPSATNNQQGYSFDCNANIPDFQTTIGGTQFSVSGSYINFSSNGDGTCYGGIQSSSGIGMNIYGDVFLKDHFVVFDNGNTQLGFANSS